MSKASPYFPWNAKVTLEPLEQMEDRAIVTIHPDTSFAEDVTEIPKPKGIEIVSNQYKLVSNEDARNLGEDILHRTGFNWEPESRIWDGNRFRQRFISKDLTMQVGGHDNLMFAADIVNSYNGTMSLGLQTLAWRQVCTNGMVARQFFDGFRIRHLKNGDMEEEILLQAEAIVNRASNWEKTLPVWDRMYERELSADEILSTLHEAIHVAKMPKSLIGKVAAHPEVLDGGTSAWTMFNHFTRELTSDNSFPSEAANERICEYFINRYGTEQEIERHEDGTPKHFG